MKAAGPIVSLVWIKGHSGFNGYEMADFYTKKAVKDGQIINITTRRDLKTEAKKRMMKEWHKEWTETQTTKGRSYAIVYNPHYNRNFGFTLQKTQELQSLHYAD
jgi:hypothetical protein